MSLKETQAADTEAPEGKALSPESSWHSPSGSQELQDSFLGRVFLGRLKDSILLRAGLSFSFVPQPVKKCLAPAHGFSLRPSHFLSGKEMSATMCKSPLSLLSWCCALIT